MGKHRTQNTHTKSTQVKYIAEMFKICQITLLICSVAGRHFLSQTEGEEEVENLMAVHPSQLHGTGAAGEEEAEDTAAVIDGVDGCIRGEKFYSFGGSLPSSDCNSCYCDVGGEVCTAMACH